MFKKLTVVLAASLAAGCGLLDNNPNSFWQFEPVIWGSSKATWSAAFALQLEEDISAALVAIDDRTPDVIGIHERTPGALERLLEALPALGHHYEVMSSSGTYESATDAGIRIAGRDVILLRSGAGLASGGPVFDNPQSGILAAGQDHPGGTRTVRGWASVDVDAGTRYVRIIAVYVESGNAILRDQWIAEIEAGPGATDREVVRLP